MPQYLGRMSRIGLLILSLTLLVLPAHTEAVVAQANLGKSAHSFYLSSKVSEWDVIDDLHVVFDGALSEDPTITQIAKKAFDWDWAVEGKKDAINIMWDVDLKYGTGLLFDIEWTTKEQKPRVKEWYWTEGGVIRGNNVSVQYLPPVTTTPGEYLEKWLQCFEKVITVNKSFDDIVSMDWFSPDAKNLERTTLEKEKNSVNETKTDIIFRGGIKEGKKPIEVQIVVDPPGEVFDYVFYIYPNQSVSVFPSLYIGIAAAVGAGVLAYLYRRRVLGRKTEGI